MHVHVREEPMVGRALLGVWDRVRLLLLLFVEAWGAGLFQSSVQGSTLARLRAHALL